MRKIILAGILTAAAISAAPAPPAAPLPEREKALHALNRLGFGPRPGDVERVAKMGVDCYIDQQLHPESIVGTDLDLQLRSSFSTLAMSNAELFTRFEEPLRELKKKYKAELAASSGAGAGTEDNAERLKREMRNEIPPENRPRRVLDELQSQKLIRAVYSEKQLNELMVDFWMNHFNVFGNKGLDRIFTTAFERDTIRPRIWGRFPDLLLATAKSPAMLFYLDNARSVSSPENRPASAMRGGGWRRRGFAQAGAQAKGKAGGLNENYAREIMELHTLGVDGGYTQSDVTQLARILTGWSISMNRQDRGEPGEYLFRARAHDAGAKTFLGRSFPPGGDEQEGERAIRMLALHPSTAHNIALKLCRRLISDDPPAALVDRAARRFLMTDGDLRETVSAIVHSPEFFAPETVNAKVKSPFELAVSALRATDAELTAPEIGPLLQKIASMGEPLYLCQPPTGYSDISSAWVNTGSLLARLNFSLALTANKIPGSNIEWKSILPGADAADPEQSLVSLNRTLTGGRLSAATQETIRSRLTSEPAPSEDPEANTQVARVAGLILGSPEFQRK